MPKREPPRLRVLRWRREGLATRLVQGVTIGILVWLETRHPMAGVWMVATSAFAIVDAMVSGSYANRQQSRRLAWLSLLTRFLSGASFSSVILVCLLDKTIVGIAAAVFVGCAITLNNAIMTRGSRQDGAILVGPSSLMLITLPIVATWLGYSISLVSGLILAIGGSAFVTFIALLAHTLYRESQDLLQASAALALERDRAEASRLEAATERGRWRTLFHQSPLPQVCLDASLLYKRLQDPRFSSGTVGENFARILAESPEVLDEIQLTEANEAARALLYERNPDGTYSRGKFDGGLERGLCYRVEDLSRDGVVPPFLDRIVMPSGRTSELEAHIRLLPEADPPWSVVLISYVDQTALRLAANAAQAANKAKSEFLAVMSHEIRTPLNGVLGMAHAMDREPLSPVQKERVGVIQESGKALLAILNDVLDLSKIEAGKLTLETAPFNLEDVALGAHAAFTSIANSKGISFNLDLNPAAKGVYLGDSARLRQILHNLISNAVKFTAEGEVRVSISRPNHNVVIRVADTGVGISPDKIADLFEPFVQADSSTTREYGGSGLGLAITRDLCHAMGGTIEAASQPGVGTTFEVQLPLQVGSAEALVETSGHSAAEPVGPIEDFRILAAEDNPINQLVLKTLLAQFDLSATIVENGEEAVARWRTGEWDLILMDVQMPVLDGPSAARQIRALEAELGRAPVPIVALTANAMVHQVESYLAAGMNDIIAKPIEILDLLRVIQAVAGAEDYAGATRALGTSKAA